MHDSRKQGYEGSSRGWQYNVVGVGSCCIVVTCLVHVLTTAFSEITFIFLNLLFSMRFPHSFLDRLINLSNGSVVRIESSALVDKKEKKGHSDGHGL